jgi:hypothetical protein
MSLSLLNWFFPSTSKSNTFYYLLFFILITVVVSIVLLYIYRDTVFCKKIIELFLFDPAQEVKLKYYKKKKKEDTEKNQDSIPDDTKKSFIKESKGEIICKKAAEELFNKKFSKVRPEILKNDVTKHNLELDIYNDELKLAIEYSGRQHYEYVPFFHKNHEAFLNQRYRDEMKKNKCKESGIKLIEVPYKVKHEDIPQFIRMKAISLGVLKEEENNKEDI